VGLESTLPQVFILEQLRIDDKGKL
jgi:hypothetical protein